MDDRLSPFSGEQYVELGRLLLATRSQGFDPHGAMGELIQRLAPLGREDKALGRAISNRKLRGSARGKVLLVQAAQLWLTGLPRCIGRGFLSFGEYLETLPEPPVVAVPGEGSLVLVDTRLQTRVVLSVCGCDMDGWFSESDPIGPTWPTPDHPTDEAYWMEMQLMPIISGNTLAGQTHSILPGWRGSRLEHLAAALLQGSIPRTGLVYAPASFTSCFPDQTDHVDTNPLMLRIEFRSGSCKIGANATESRPQDAVLMRDRNPT